jgi:hypothetical protein
MADPLTFALTQPELAAELVRLQLHQPLSAATYQAFFNTVPVEARPDAHEFAIIARSPVTWTQEESLNEAIAEVRAPGFIRCWLEGRDGWRILGASGPLKNEGRLEVRIDVASPSAVFGFPVMLIVNGVYDPKRCAGDSCRYLLENGLWDDEVPRTFLIACFVYLQTQIDQIISWFQKPQQSLRFGRPRSVKAYEKVGLQVMDYPFTLA